MYKRYLFIFCNLAILYFVYGCQSNEVNEVGYNENLISNLEEVEAIYKVHPISEYVFGAGLLEITKACEKLILLDHFTKELFLTNNNGEILEKTGGEGRGPGELNMPVHFSLDKDSIHVLDPANYRINIFQIDEREMRFHTSRSYKDPSEHFMASYYHTVTGSEFGVYNVSQGYFTPENEHRLYRLDDSLNPEKELLLMPGEERQMVESSNFTMYVPHQYLHRTHWYVDGDWFYYAKSDDSTIFRYHLETGKEQEITFLTMEKRTNSTAFSDLVIQTYSENDGDEYDAEYWEALHEMDDLPLFTSLLVKDYFIYLSLLPTPGSEGITLLLDMEKQETRYFHTPQEFIPRAVCGNSVYGIDFRVGNTQQVGKVQLIK